MKIENYKDKMFDAVRDMIRTIFNIAPEDLSVTEVTFTPTGIRVNFDKYDGMDEWSEITYNIHTSELQMFLFLHQNEPTN